MALEEKTRFIAPPDTVIRTWRTSRLFCFWLNLSALAEADVLTTTDADTLKRVAYQMQNKSLPDKYACYLSIADPALQQRYRDAFLVPEDKDKYTT